MPFELGVDFGCRRFGAQNLTPKRSSYRYQAAISDLAGSDIEPHGGDYRTAVRKVRNWITGIWGFGVVAAARIFGDYEDFQKWHYERPLDAGFSEEEIQD